MEIIFNPGEENRLLEEKGTDTEGLTGKFSRAASLCLEYDGISPDNVEISLTFTDEDRMRELNRDFRGNDSVTDVLSFPQFDWEEDPDEDSLSVEDAFEFDDVMLGDVVICVRRALLQAEEFGHSAERELIYLFTHSVFHLLGYDHMDEDDKKKMRTAEKHVMRNIMPHTCRED